MSHCLHKKIEKVTFKAKESRQVNQVHLQTGTSAQTRASLFPLLEWSLHQMHRRSLCCTKTAKNWRQQQPQHSNPGCVYRTALLCKWSIQRGWYKLYSVSVSLTPWPGPFKAWYRCQDLGTCSRCVGVLQHSGTGGDSKWQELRLTGNARTLETP